MYVDICVRITILKTIRPSRHEIRTAPRLKLLRINTCRKQKCVLFFLHNKHFGV